MLCLPVWSLQLISFDLSVSPDVINHSAFWVPTARSCVLPCCCLQVIYFFLTACFSWLIKLVLFSHSFFSRGEALNCFFLSMLPLMCPVMGYSPDYASCCGEGDSFSSASTVLVQCCSASQPCLLLACILGKSNSTFMLHLFSHWLMINSSAVVELYFPKFVPCF